MRRDIKSVRFCWYAGDGVVHCKSEQQSRLVLRKLARRMREYGLELHPKTRVVCCWDVNRQATFDTIQFTYLGSTFRLRISTDKYARVYVNFLPAVSRDALRDMKQTLRSWHI